MKKDDVIKYFGSQAKTARALGISRQAVNRWSGTVPPIMAHLIRLITNGELK